MNLPDGLETDDDYYPTNIGEKDETTDIDRDEEWLLYDQLPQKLRDLLKYCNVDYSVKAWWEDYEDLKYRFTLEKIYKKWRKEIYSESRDSVALNYGKSHPQAKSKIKIEFV